MGIVILKNISKKGSQETLFYFIENIILFEYLYDMDRDFVISIIKFMNQMGMKVSVDISRSYRNHNGKKTVCLEVIVHYKDRKEYISYHCYELRHDKIAYSEGNKVMGVEEGILAYLGNSRDVENYLEGLARYEAKKFFEKSF